MKYRFMFWIEHGIVKLGGFAWMSTSKIFLEKGLRKFGYRRRSEERYFGM